MDEQEYQLLLVPPLRHRSLLGREDEVAAAIALPAVLGLLGALRTFFAARDRKHTVGGYPETDQVVFDSIRTAIAEP